MASAVAFGFSGQYESAPAAVAAAASHVIAAAAAGAP